MSGPARSRMGYDAFAVIEREVWASAAGMLGAAEAPAAARRKAMRRAQREAGRGDFFAARHWVRIAEAIDWLSSPKPPRQVRAN